MNIFKKYSYMLVAGVALAGAASCSDPGDEITSVEYARSFTPTDVKVKVEDNTKLVVEWNYMMGPGSFTVEIYEGETCTGSPVVTLYEAPIKSKGTMSTIWEDAEGSTTYIARVCSTDQDGGHVSNWGVAEKAVKTKAENILLESQPGDITETSIKVRWTAFKEVTSISYVALVDGAEVQTKAVSSEEVAEGVAVLSDLIQGTEYEVTLLNGEKSRGKQTFATKGSAPKPIVIEGVFIDYNMAEAPTAGITMEGTTVMASAKIHTNADAVNAIQLKNGYSSETSLTGNHIKLTVEGGFKLGDKVTIAGFFNNADDTKKSAADLFVKDGDTYKVLFTTQQFINGRTVADDPKAETFVLTEDAPELYIGRNGNTGTNISLIQVERGKSDPIPGPDPVPSDDPFAAAGTLLTFDAKQDSYSKDGFVLTLVDTDGKIAVDDNSAYFGAGPATCQKFTKRLKTGGKSSSKNNMTVTVPAAGKLYICVRTGSNSATDRNIVVSKGETELVNKLLLESEALQDQTIEGEATTQKIYAPIVVDVEAGEYAITYPTSSINFYGMKFIAK